MSNITRHRGDDRTITRTVRIGGVAQDITGWTFALTVNEEANPADTTNELGSVAGVLIDAANGQVGFDPTTTMVETVGRFYYDIEVVDANGKLSTVKGLWVVLQDITKSDEAFVWTPDETPADGAAVPMIPAAGPQVIRHYSVPSCTYETRDGRRVIRDNTIPTATYDMANVRFFGTDFPRFAFTMPGWEWRLTVYVNRALAQMTLWDAYTGTMWNRPELDTRLGTVVAKMTGSSIGSDGQQIDGDAPAIDTSGWPVAGWYELGVRVLADWSIEWMVKEETDPDDWRDAFVGDSELWTSSFSATTGPKPNIAREYPENAASVVEVWKYEWRRL